MSKSTPVSRHDNEMTGRQSFTKNLVQNLTDLQEMLQGDLECILDGLEDRILINAQQAVVDRIKEYKANQESK